MLRDSLKRLLVIRDRINGMPLVDLELPGAAGCDWR